MCQDTWVVASLAALHAKEVATPIFHPYEVHGVVIVRRVRHGAIHDGVGHAHRDARVVCRDMPGYRTLRATVHASATG